MDEMDKRRNGRERLFNLFYDIKDLLTDLKEGNNDGLKIRKSVKSMLAKLEEQALIVNVDKEELKSIKKLKAEIREALLDFL